MSRPRTDIGPFSMVPQWMVAAVREASPTKLGSTLVVWVTLSGFANGTTGECHPSHAKIAECAGVGETTVKQSLNLLRSVGALSWTQRRSDDGDLTSNLYVLHHADPTLRVTDPEGVGLWSAPPQVLGDPTGGALERRVTRTTTNNKTTSPPSAAPGFAEWWKEFPRKTAKAEAAKAYVKALGKPDVTEATLLAAIREQVANPPWSDVQFCPYPTTWLNQERWDDTSAPTKPKGSNDMDWSAWQ